MQEQSFILSYKDKIAQDLVKCFPYQEVSKDILMVVHNQLEYVKTSIESIINHTNNFNLYIWDNASDNDVAEFIYDKMYSLEKVDGKKITVVRSNKNVGFVVPNNELVKIGNSEYIILINSDTQVYPSWDTHMIGFLQNNPQYLQVGYQGGLLDEAGTGIDSAFGDDIDYVCGWCFCISRDTYNRLGLFDEKFEFAYCEDADFSLKIKQIDHSVYALHLATAHHFGNKTIKKLQEDGYQFIYHTFQSNHDYMKQKWHNYLIKQRVRAK